MNIKKHIIIFLIVVIMSLIIYKCNKIEYMINVIDPMYIFSFTTSPLRISKIKPFIDSLLNQSIPVFKIYANLPYVFKRDNTKFTNIPEFISNNPKIVINWCEDIGPATKIIPCAKLLSKTQHNIPIISVDDDHHYSPILAKTLIDVSNRYPKTVITGATFIHDELRKDQLLTVDKNKNMYFAQILEGFSGVLYYPSMFDQFNLDSINHMPKFCYLADDLIISNYILSKGYRILSIESRDLMKSLDYGLLSDALHYVPKENEIINKVFPGGGNIINYKKCIKWLKDKNNLHIQENSLPKYLIP